MTPEHKALVAAKADILEWIKSFPEADHTKSLDALYQIDAAIESLSAQGEAEAARPAYIGTPNDILTKLAQEYRPTMDREVLHSWAGDVVAALPAAPAPVTDAVEAIIRKTLLDYRQSEVADEDGSGYPLVDALTMDGHGIDMGEREIDNIVDELMYALRSALASNMPVGDGYVPASQECTTEGCGKPATVHFIRGGIGSYYCHECYMRVQKLAASTREPGR